MTLEVNYVMKQVTLLLALLTILSSCSKDKGDILMDPASDFRFEGNFMSQNSELISGTIRLTISGGSYSCNTNLPYGQGAGLLITGGNSMEFRDTLFFIIPAMYGPSFVLSGKYNYQYDGEQLELWRSEPGMELNYSLSRKD